MQSYRDQFPILKGKINSKSLVYFDNAATTQKPISVINAINEYYQNYNSNIHRGAHFLADLATEKYENIRKKLAQFIGAKPSEIIFTSGATQSINLLMQSWGRKFLSAQDNIVLSEMEHHANIVPWLALKEEIGFEIRYIPMNQNCELDIQNLESLFDTNTKLLSVAYISNAIGTIHPLDSMIGLAKSKKILVHLDSAQAIQHKKIDVKAMNIDFMSFSSHKMYGPMGVGVFWGKEEHLLTMNPYLYGGEMIKEVFLDKVIYNDLPFKFEAGTPNVADVIGLGSAIDFIQGIGLDNIANYEKELHTYFYNRLSKLEGIKIYTPKENATAVISFLIDNIHPYDIGKMLDTKAIAIRTGHHCCQPLMRKLNIEGTCRASLALYNTKEEIDYFMSSIQSIIPLLR